MLERIDLEKRNKRKSNSTTDTQSQPKRSKQETIDRLIINFVTDALLPFKIVENPSFKELISTAFPRKTLLDRHTTSKDIVAGLNTFKSSIVETFNDINYMCITADCWSIYHR